MQTSSKLTSVCGSNSSKDSGKQHEEIGVHLLNTAWTESHPEGASDRDVCVDIIPPSKIVQVNGPPSPRDG